MTRHLIRMCQRQTQAPDWRTAASLARRSLCICMTSASLPRLQPNRACPLRARLRCRCQRQSLLAISPGLLIADCVCHARHAVYRRLQNRSSSEGSSSTGYLSMSSCRILRRFLPFLSPARCPLFLEAVWSVPFSFLFLFSFYF